MSLHSAPRGPKVNTLPIDAEPSANGKAHANGKPADRLPAPSPTGQSVRAILMSAPKLSEEDWKAFREQELARTPPKRRPLVRYLLFRCGRKAICWIGNEEIANELGYDERTVRRWLIELESVGPAIVLRIAVAIRSRRIIVFPDHPLAEQTLTFVKQGGQNVRAKADKMSGLRRTKCPQKLLSIETKKSKSSSSSTPPPARERSGDDDDVSLRSQESGGSKQKPTPLSDDEGLDMVCRVADRCTRLPGMAAKLRAALPLGRRIDHNWRGLAMQVIRLDDLIAAGEIKFRTIENPPGYVVGMLKKLRSTKLSVGEMDAFQAKLERFLKPTPPPVQRRKDPGPDHAAEIAALELDLVGLKADVAAATRPIEKRCAQRALDHARKELATLKSNPKKGDGQSHLAASGTH